MRLGHSRKIALLAMVISGGFVVSAATAYACTALATIHMNSKTATPGQVVEASGKDFSGLPTNSAVTVHWNALDGAVRWSGKPNLDGTVTFSFEVPKDAKPGRYYTVVATQYTSSGSAVYGTPARASIRIVAPRASRGQI
ncbi:MAG TPA: hypothetical protein VM784_02350 [Actinomycetota bacterium]|nr:hypothetical protein [Actinomycetota bacterium]